MEIQLMSNNDGDCTFPIRKVVVGPDTRDDVLTERASRVEKGACFQRLFPPAPQNSNQHDSNLL